MSGQADAKIVPDTPFGVAPPDYKPPQKPGKTTTMSKLQKLHAMRTQKAKRDKEFAEVSKRATARVLACGAGVQSTAALLLWRDQYDYVIFADPGAEHEVTYEHIEKRLKPYTNAGRPEFITVRNEQTLEDYCKERRVVPLRTRRWCTGDWKIEPMHKFYKSLGATQEKPVIVDVCISWDEAWRASAPDRVNYEWRNYPMVDKEVSRARCEAIILEHGWPLPHKSACDFCPYQTTMNWRQLLAEKPERFQELIQLEKNGKHYPEVLLGRKPLESILESSANKLTDAEQAAADAEADQACTSGYCWT